LMIAVGAGLTGASVSITTLGRAISGPTFIKHKIKRLDRLVGNRHLKSDRIALYGAMARFLLKSLPLPLIIIDWSPLTDDQSQQLLRASLPVGGRAITLYEEVHPCNKLGNCHIQHQFLAHLKQLFPPYVTPIVVADSGFRTPFFREVEHLHWHWLGRIRNRDFIAFTERSDDGFAAKLLYAKATRKPKLLGLAHWVRRNPLSGQLVTFFRTAQGRKHLTVQKQPAKSKHSRQQAKREKEPWLLVVSPSLEAYSAIRIVDYYRTRMQIEEGFRDTKSHHYGLDLTRESRIQAERRANLLLIAALIIFALWLVGLSLKGTATERQIKVNSGTKRSPFSLIFFGKIACRYVVFELPDDYLKLAQVLLVGYFEKLEKG
ncbi:MAG: IS4 family transposase, partial [Methylobacter sp.]|uniref:IS4 family transposase n=1 Tax=Methylobacter sp. TaxID=2051955 RepID=UPI002730418A